MADEGAVHEDIVGGLFAEGKTVIEPQFLLVERPLESVAVIVTENVPVDV